MWYTAEIVTFFFFFFSITVHFVVLFLLYLQILSIIEFISISKKCVSNYVAYLMEGKRFCYTELTTVCVVVFNKLVIHIKGKN